MISGQKVNLSNVPEDASQVPSSDDESDKDVSLFDSLLDFLRQFF